MKLYYIRHGKTEGNVAKNYIGQSESPLIEEGIDGAKSVARDIIKSGEHIDAMYTSRLSRQRDTAHIIASIIGFPLEKITVTDLLLERAAGSFEGKPQSEFFSKSEEEQVAAGAESFKELAERAVELIHLAHTHQADETVLFVGSAAIGEMLRAMIKYGDYTRMFDDGPMPNSSLIQLI